MKLAELTWPEVETLDRDAVVICPLGALEQHGPHLPFFTDSILCEAVATRLEAALPRDVLLLPLQWLGASAHHLGMAGTLTAGTGTYLHLICVPLRCLLRSGFRRVFILNGHGGNVDGFHLALRQLALEFSNALLSGASYWDLAIKETAELLEGKRKAVGHACEFETSLMLHLRPDLVRSREMRDGDLIHQDTALSAVYIPLDMKRQTRHGVTGQPTLATAEKGQALFEIIATQAVAVVKTIRNRALS